MQTIEQVVERLGEVVEWATRHEEPAGYFAALYRTVTVRVAEGIRDGFFDDGPRMERFDVVFATRYLEAFDAWTRGAPTTRAWAVTFAMTRHWRPIVIQHLLGGMNAHINLDLGIAAASVAAGEPLSSLKGDFSKINTILASLVQATKDDLSAIWPPLRWIDRLSGPADDAIVNFSMVLARDGAWEFAERLAGLPKDEWLAAIDKRDQVIGTRLADLVYRPGMLASLLLLGIRLAERGTTSSKIDRLMRA